MTLSEVIRKRTVFGIEAKIGDGSFPNTNIGQIAVSDATASYISASNDANNAVIFIGSDAIGGIIGTYTANDLTFRTNNSQRGIITSSGDFGIATTSPSCRLQIGNNSVAGLGDLQVRNNSASYISVTNSGNNCVGFFGSDGDGGIIGTFSSHTFSIRSNNSNRITVLSNGDVGINTTTPARKLHVNGIVRLQGLSTYANNAAAIAGGLVADDVYKTSTGELRIVV
jgi:hypothetical protein